MVNYRKTIVQNRPEYVGRNLLLANKDKSGLFILDKSSQLLINIHENGGLDVNKITQNKQIKLDISLRRIGETYLNLKDPSVTTMLKYLVTPEMEVERIFNSLRYKYLKSIYLSEIESPQNYINASYNRAFQALAGLNVYQGNVKERKDNERFWKDEEFTDSAKDQNWETERNELKRILTLIRKLNSESANNKNAYAELIAIKPGFHELYIHDDFFEILPKKVKGKYPPRDNVFIKLRNKEDDPGVILDELPKKISPYEINGKNYFTYASCNVTEGPFVFRKGIAVSYYEEIRKIRSKDELGNLDENFHILDYQNENKNYSLEDLGVFLKRAECFCKFLN